MCLRVCVSVCVSACLCVCVSVSLTWVKYEIALDSKTLLRFTELVWCIVADEILSKSANPAFWSSWLAQLHQARSIKHRKVFESKTIPYVAQVWSVHMNVCVCAYVCVCVHACVRVCVCLCVIHGLPLSEELTQHAQEPEQLKGSPLTPSSSAVAMVTTPHQCSDLFPPK